MFKKIVCVVMLFTVLVLSGCAGNRLAEFSSIEEMQAELSEFYFFDFDVDIIRMADFYAETNQKGSIGCSPREFKYLGYYVLYEYLVEPQSERFAYLSVESQESANTIDDRISQTNFIGEHIIDDVRCLLFSDREKATNGYIFKTIFKIENVTYVITLEIRNGIVSLDYFLSIVEPAITNRYKGIKG